MKTNILEVMVEILQKKSRKVIENYLKIIEAYKESLGEHLNSIVRFNIYIEIKMLYSFQYFMSFYSYTPLQLEDQLHSITNSYRSNGIQFTKRRGLKKESLQHNLEVIGWNPVT